MRDYGKVNPQFWVGQTGRGLRGNMQAQIVALYLMTSPHANMIGVFYCPIEYIAKETGLTIEGASKGLQSLIEADFCTYEEASEYVFVHEFAHNQVGDSLKVNDKRVQGVQNELAKVPKGQCWQSFRARYAVPYNLPIEWQKHKPLESPLQAPSKPETEAGAETEDIASVPAASRKRAVTKPDGVEDQTWADWQTLRKAKKAPVTQTAIDGIGREAEKAGIGLNDALLACCEFGWQGFNADWYTARKGAAQPKTLAGVI